MLSSQYKQAYKKILEAKNILLVTHARPDGDALSSIGVMMELLIKLNKSFFAYCLDKPPIQYNFLPHIEKISAEKIFSFKDFDLIIPLDCGSMSRTNLVKEISNRNKKQFIIEFDHHPRVDDYADIEIRIADASSTAEILYNFLKANKIKINKNFATGILTGILTDTGNFLYPSTTDRTICIASKMQLLGANFPQILESTWRNKSLSAMKFWGKAMENLHINKKYNFAFSVLKYEDIKNSNSSDEELEGIAGFLSNLYGVKGLVLLREEKPGLIKGSLRTSHPKIDISKLGHALGGGGHAKASGFVVEGSIKQTEKGWEVV